MITTDTEARSTIARQNDHFRRHPCKFACNSVAITATERVLRRAPSLQFRADEFPELAAVSDCRGWGFPRLDQ